MKVLVTGGSGFVGLALCRALGARGDEVLAVDLEPRPGLTALMADMAGRVSFRPCEITEWATLADCFAAFQPDAVVHGAAVVGVTNSVSNPVGTMRTNVEGAFNVFNLARLNRVCRVVHLSSEEVYGPFEADPIDETHPCRPLKPYGISKYAVERLARDFTESGELDIIHLRLSWAYGPGLPRPRVPKNLIDAAIASEPLHLSSGGDFRVDHTYVDDAVSGLLCALDVGAHENDVYNIGSGSASSLFEIVEIIRELLPGADISVGPGNYELQPGLAAVRKGALDISRAKAELGYVSAFDMRSGLAVCIEALATARAAIASAPESAKGS